MSWPFRIALSLRNRLVRRLALIAGEDEDPSRLTVQRIFGAHEFEPDHVSVRWLDGGNGYIDPRAVDRSVRRPRHRAPRSQDRRDRDLGPCRASDPARCSTRPLASTIMRSRPTDRGS